MLGQFSTRMCRKPERMRFGPEKEPKGHTRVKPDLFTGEGPKKGQHVTQGVKLDLFKITREENQQRHPTRTRWDSCTIQKGRGIVFPTPRRRENAATPRRSRGRQHHPKNAASSSFLWACVAFPLFSFGWCAFPSGAMMSSFLLCELPWVGDAFSSLLLGGAPENNAIIFNGVFLFFFFSSLSHSFSLITDKQREPSC